MFSSFVSYSQSILTILSCFSRGFENGILFLIVRYVLRNEVNFLQNTVKKMAQVRLKAKIVTEKEKKILDLVIEITWHQKLIHMLARINTWQNPFQNWTSPTATVALRVTGFYQ